MRGVNKAIILGRLGRDPEVRYTQAGKAVATLSVATDSSWTKDGQRHEKTEWHRIVAWGKLAEIAKEYLAKGRQVYIEGRLQTRKWDDNKGNKRQTTEIVADQIVMLGHKNDTSHGKDTMEMIMNGDEVPGEFDGPSGGSF